MSWLNEMVDAGEVASQDQLYDRTTEKLAPGAFTGALGAVGPGLLRGAIEAGRTIQTTAMQLGSAAIESDLSIGAGYFPEFEGGQVEAQQEFGEGEARRIGEETAKSVMNLRPDLTEVGVVGQILGEAAAILPRTVAGAVAGGPLGAAVAAGAPAGYSGKQVAMAEGIDETTATLKGAIDAGTVGIGAILPVARFVGPVLGDAAISVGANVGLGMAGRGLTAEVLEKGGYTTQAAQYRMMDGTAIATDAILGAAFFGIGRASMRKPTTDQVDAALTERTTQHFDVDAAPGAPVDPRSAMSHQEALRTAIGQLSRGEPVAVPESIHSADFLRGNEPPAPKAPTREEAITTARQDLEPIVRAELEQEAVGVLPNVADVRTELAAVSRSLEGLDETFRARAKEFQDEGMGRKGAETAARKAIEQERQELTDRVAALEGSLNGNRTGELARGELAALARGETPERLQPRIEERADQIMQGFERKPLASGVTQGNARMNLAAVARQEIARLIAEQDALAPRAEPVGLDIGTPKAVTKTQDSVTEPAGAATKQAESVTSGSKPLTPERDPADLASPSQADSDPTIQLADEIMARMDDMRLPTGALDDEGRPVTVSARELLAQADDEIKAAQQDARGFAAAAACFLQRGLG
ncbi:hypothetical protein H8F21_22250 [Pseudomonas sp. P66]|uniref:Uncharacterized protein n=1 Tax=Pseudomonas arcuscaelestis TaxID=2710591 RepID=A0ABS2C326_9PSED|nr:hypothetical protein [Pseudomonas arcuscaelestis]MBM5460290.1 hypothetical protein [Pseudomonas arcuscaelestis]